MRVFLFRSLFLVLLVNSLSYAQAGCGCTPKVLDPIRKEVKHRTIPTGNPSGDSVNVADIISWEIPSKTYVEKPTSLFAKEKKVFTVTGFIRLYKIADDDCDIHIEISETEAVSSPRIIVDIPNTPEYCSVITELFNQEILYW